MEPSKSISFPDWETLHQNMMSQDSEKASQALKLFQDKMDDFNTIQLFETRRTLKLLKSESKDQIKFKKILDRMDAIQMRILSSSKANENDVLIIIDNLKNVYSLERLFALLSIPDNEGKIPLHNPYVAKFLCERIEEFSQDQIFALLSMEDNDGKTPLHNPDVVQYLYESIVQLSTNQLQKFLYYWCSTEKGYALIYDPDLSQHFSEIMKKLPLSKLGELKEKIDIPMGILSSSKSQEQDILTIIDNLQEVSQEELFVYLSIQDKDGRTPLHNPYVVKYLCERIEEFTGDQSFALLTIKDNNGKMPIHNPEVFQYLHDSIVKFPSNKLLEILTEPGLVHCYKIIKKLPPSKRLDTLKNYDSLLDETDMSIVQYFLEMLNILSDHEFIAFLEIVDSSIINDSFGQDLIDRVNKVASIDDFFYILYMECEGNYGYMRDPEKVKYFHERMKKLSSIQLFEILSLRNDDDETLFHSRSIRHSFREEISNLPSDQLKDLIFDNFIKTETQLEILEDFHEWRILNLPHDELFSLLPWDITEASMHACNIGQHFLACVASLPDDELIEFLGTIHEKGDFTPLCLSYIRQCLNQRLAEFTTEQWVEVLSHMSDIKDSNVEKYFFEKIEKLSPEGLFEWLSSRGTNGIAPIHNYDVAELFLEKIISLSPELLFKLLTNKDISEEIPFYEYGYIYDFNKAVVDLSKSAEKMAPLFKLLRIGKISCYNNDASPELIKSVIPFLSQYPEEILNLVSSDLIYGEMLSHTLIKSSLGKMKVHYKNVLLIFEGLRILRSRNCKREITLLQDIAGRLGMWSYNQKEMLEIIRYFNDSSCFSHLHKDSYLAFYIMKMVFDLMNNYVEDPAIEGILKRFTSSGEQPIKDMNLIGFEIDGYACVYPSNYLKEKSKAMDTLLARPFKDYDSDPMIKKYIIGNGIVIPMFNSRKIISNDQINWHGFFQYLENLYANVSEFLNEENIQYLI